LANFLFDTFSLDNNNSFTVYGYGANPANTTQPYAPENIIIVSKPSTTNLLLLIA
jgi:hypothetical protein